MDYRIEKTKHSIYNAFIGLRSRKPLERITVKEICEIARINKSTFYAHYADIYDLSEQIESEIISEVIQNLGDIDDAINDAAKFVHNLSLEYRAKNTLIMTVFSGSRREQLPQKILAAIKAQIFARYPDYADRPEKNVMLTYCVYGGYYAFYENLSYDGDTVLKIIGSIADRAVALE